ncbi:MAG TPA: hypothetical protein VJT32_01160 [bacterium]|nr:hypothetical protein [bacterium]
MRMMMRVTFPVEAGNKAIQENKLPGLFQSAFQALKPEAAYFFPDNGKRAALFFFDLKDSSHIVAAAEPFFMGVNATVEMTPVMNQDELKAGLERLGR